MKPIYPLGILGGMGPYSTAPFLNHVLDACKRLYSPKSDLDFPHIIIYSLPTPYHPEDKGYGEGVVDTLKVGIDALVKSGAQVIAVPCNSVHRFYETMTQLSSVPVLNIIDETILKLEKNTKPIGLLATRATIESTLYQKGLETQGKAFFWDDSLQTKVDQLVASFKAVGVNEDTKTIWKNIARHLHTNQVQEVLIGCTDLFFCALLSPELRFYDSSVILAEKLVRMYITHALC